MRLCVYLPSDVPAFRATPARIERLSRALPQHELVHAESESEYERQLPRAQGAIVWSFAESDYARAPELEHVFTPAAGHERIALDPNGRVSAHFGTFHGKLMAESLAAMLLFQSRRLGAALAAQREHRWQRELFEGTQRLHGQIALLLGYGAIGRHAARCLSALGLRVHGLKRDTSRGRDGVERVFGAHELFVALAQADHVVCLLPADSVPSLVLDAEAFSHMKPSACVYNLGRGQAIDEAALLNALESGQIRGAFLDVTREEPLPASSPLWDAPNLFITPHASAIFDEYLELYFDELASSSVLAARRK